MNLYSVTHGYDGNKNDHKIILSILSNDLFAICKYKSNSI